MKEKVAKPERLGIRPYLGTTLMSVCDSLGMSVMTSWFMQYLTDYAGIGTWGAVLGTTLLLVARIIDAVNDPLQGWIIDRSKVTKFGKYRPFILLSILMCTIGVGGLFSIPSGMSDSPVIICIWVLFFYLMYDIGASFYTPNLIYRTITKNEGQRGKLIVGPRILNMIIGMVCGSLIAIVNSVSASMGGNMHDAFSVVMIGAMIVVGIVSVLGVLLVKEKHSVEQKEDVEKAKFSDFFLLLKENAALRVKVLASVFWGFCWTFLFATMLYYIKWAYCADLTTGAVDTAAYGMLSLFGSMMMMLPLVIGTAVANPLMKLFKSAAKTYIFCILLLTIPCGLMFVLQLLGILQTSSTIFLVLLAVAATAIGISYIPQEVINMETMDYEMYLHGKDRAAQCNACYKFLEKAQNAIAGSVVGMILIAIGYQVDSATDTYLGELSAIPGMLNWFIVVMGLVPCVLGVIAVIILRKYPITDEIRKDMREKLSK